VEVDIGQNAVVAFERERVAADEKILVTLEAEHAVARSDSYETAVGAHPHDGGIEMSAWTGVPAGIQPARAAGGGG